MSVLWKLSSSRSFPIPTFKYIYQKKKKEKMDLLQGKKKEAALTSGMETIDSSIAPVGYSFFRLLFPDSSFMKQLRLPRSFSGQVQVDKQKEPRQIAELINPKFQSWKVNLHKDTQGFYFFHGEGWQELATAHKLKLGYFLTFDYNGGLLFRFRVYGLNTTEIDNYPSQEEEKESKGKAVYEAVIGSTNLLSSYMHIPRACKKLVEISEEGKKRKVVLMDGEGRKWPVRLVHKKRRCGSGRSSISAGWLSFAHGNGLRRGDRCVFEPVLQSFESFESLIKVRIIRGDV